MSTRRFKIHTHLTMPLELLAGPGAVHARREPGDVIELDPERCRVFDRFLRGRVRAGDMTELEAEAPSSSAVSAATRAAKEQVR